MGICLKGIYLIPFASPLRMSWKVECPGEFSPMLLRIVKESEAAFIEVKGRIVETLQPSCGSLRLKSNRK